MSTDDRGKPGRDLAADGCAKHGHLAGWHLRGERPDGVGERGAAGGDNRERFSFGQGAGVRDRTSQHEARHGRVKIVCCLAIGNESATELFEQHVGSQGKLFQPECPDPERGREEGVEHLRRCALALLPVRNLADGVRLSLAEKSGGISGGGANGPFA